MRASQPEVLSTASESLSLGQTYCITPWRMRQFTRQANSVSEWSLFAPWTLFAVLLAALLYRTVLRQTSRVICSGVVLYWSTL